MLRPKRSVLEEVDETDFYEEDTAMSGRSRRCGCRHSCDDYEDEETLDELFPADDYGCGCRPKPKPCPPKPCPPRPCPPRPCPEPEPEPETPNCAGQVLAMAYVVEQEFNARNVYNCKKALQNGTLFTELDKPFKGGCGYEE